MKCTCAAAAARLDGELLSLRTAGIRLLDDVLQASAVSAAEEQSNRAAARELRAVMKKVWELAEAEWRSARTAVHEASKQQRELDKAAARAEAQAARAQAEAEAALAQARGKQEAEARARAKAEAAEEARQRTQAEKEERKADAARGKAEEAAKRKAEAEAAKAEAERVKAEKEERKADAASDKAEEAAKRKAEAEAAKAEAERVKAEAAELARLEAQQEIERQIAAAMEKPKRPDQAEAAAASLDASSKTSESPRGSATSTAQARLERAQSRFAGLRRRSTDSGGSGAPAASASEAHSGASRLSSHSFFGRGAGGAKSESQAPYRAANVQEPAESSHDAAMRAQQHADAKAGGAWLRPWQESGGVRAAEMDATVSLNGSCLCGDDAVDSGESLLACIGGDGDGKSVSVYSGRHGKLLQTLTGHTDLVCCVALQGDLVVSAGRDQTIRLWSRKRGACTATVSGCAGPVYALAVSGNLLLSGEGSAKAGTVRRWVLENAGATAHSAGAEHAGPVWCISIGADAAISASYDTTCRVWPIAGSEGGETTAMASTGKLPHPSWVNAVSVHGDLAATGCGDGKLRLWSLDSLSCLRTLTHSQGISGTADPMRSSQLKSYQIYSVYLTSGVLVSGSEETLKVWSLPAGGGEPECVTTMSHGSKVKGLALCWKGGLIASAGGTVKKVIVWRAAGAALKR